MSADDCNRPARILALDVGERRTGLAATDPTGTISVPLPAIEHKGMERLDEALAEVVAEREPELLVVGVPLLLDGGVGSQARKVRAVVDRLKARFPDIQVETVDESLSTDEAHELLKETGLKAARRKRKADSVAALVILQRYLESTGRGGITP